MLITIAHEVRHIYQATQIRHMIEGDAYDPNAVLWAADMENGVSDTHKDSKQIDAVVFSHFFAVTSPIISYGTNSNFAIRIQTKRWSLRSSNRIACAVVV